MRFGLLEEAQSGIQVNTSDGIKHFMAHASPSEDTTRKQAAVPLFKILL